MSPESTIDAARGQLAPVLRDREAVWSGQVDRVIGPAAAQGLINSPPVQKQIADLILAEMRVRGTLCADAVAAALGPEGECRVGLRRDELTDIARIVFGECTRRMEQMCDGFAALSHGAEMPTVEQCRLEGHRAITERMDQILALPVD